MSKRKLFFYLFAGFSVVRFLMSLFFQDFFLFRHIWLLYLICFLLTGVVLFLNFPTVPICQTEGKVECIMLGDGRMTNEIFDKRKYGNYKLLFESDQGRAYSSGNGEMIYTKPSFMKIVDGDTVLTLGIYTVLYTCVGLYAYEAILGLVNGTIDMEVPIHTLKQNIGALNLLSDRYPIRENIKNMCCCLYQIFVNAQTVLQNIYSSITG